MTKASLKKTIQDLSAKVQAAKNELDYFMSEKTDAWRRGENGQAFETCADNLDQAEGALDDAAGALE